MDKRYVDKLLGNLVALDHQTTRAYYEMGQLLNSFREDKLYTALGYESFGSLVEEELTFTVTSATSYIALYREFKRLRYTKAEALKLLQNHGYTHLLQVLPSIKQKIGTRAMKTRVAAIDVAQMNFMLTNAEQQELRNALLKFGASELPSGRFTHTSAALMELVRSINGNRKKAA